jgi:hypothetical protein
MSLMTSQLVTSIDLAGVPESARKARTFIRDTLGENHPTVEIEPAGRTVEVTASDQSATPLTWGLQRDLSAVPRDAHVHSLDVACDLSWEPR